MGGSAVRRWVVPGVLGAVLGGAALGLVAVVNGQPVRDLVVLGLGVGALMGVLAGLLRRTVDPTVPPMGPGDPYVDTLHRSQLSDFRREAFRGPVPADPERRAAAIRLLRRTLDHESAERFSSLVFYVVALLFGVVDSLDNTWSLILVVLGAGLLIWTLVRPGRIRRRIAELRAAGDPSAAR
ncbi:hypothetical protein [Nakamurella deserti]|uniref:hypothetical protein n=1 Tax=Nakamurella deserti TaxID=2164074 RepID=UPI000DBE998C|nr:hypothetical protein [Nakamurella deserti]